MFEFEGNVCSLMDSIVEEYVLVLVEYVVDEVWDRINWFFLGGKMGYLKRNGDGSLFYSVVNMVELDVDEEEIYLVDLSLFFSKLFLGFIMLGFKDERRNKVIFFFSVIIVFLMQNNLVFGDLKLDEMELLYLVYGDEIGVQCVLSLQEFVKDVGSYSKKVVDDFLDQIIGGDYFRMFFQLKQRRNVFMKFLDEVKVGDVLGDSSGFVLDFMLMKLYFDVFVDIFMFSFLGKVKKELDFDDSYLNLDEIVKFLQDLYEVQVECGGFWLLFNFSFLFNVFERDQYYLGSFFCLSVGEQLDVIYDFYEFFQFLEFVVFIKI